MNYRIFGKTGKKVSVLGFGCMRLPVLDKDNGKVDMAEISRMFHYAIDQGVNYFDTAYTYHEGNGEEAVAKALEGHRSKVYVATKLPVWNVQKHEDMESLLDEQLRRLKTDVIDFYLVHALNRTYWKKLVDLDLLEFLYRIKKKGKVQHLGFSFHDDYEQFVTIMDSFPWEFCQIQYNYLDENYQAGTQGLKYAHQKGLGIAIMEPLRGGTLVNKLLPEVQKLIDKVSGLNPAELALKWIWNHPEIAVVLSGMTEMANVVDNIRYSQDSEKPLLPEERKLISQIQQLYRQKAKVDCTACKYCMPCPSGVDIPQCFEYYNQAMMFEDVKRARFWYNRIGKASNCTECGNCEEYCPQNIKIIDTLKEVRELLETEDEAESPAAENRS
ncbi:MAG: aldo/keto reductase [Peptococcaceae bacterium]|nr:aldo/keto reductase [Peptococcaceae bacterium]